MRSSRSSGTTSACPRPERRRFRVAALARVLAVVLLAWILVPVAAQSSQAFAGSVMATAFGTRDNLTSTTSAQSTYPGTLSATQNAQVLGLISLGVSSSSVSASPVNDTAAANADAGGIGITLAGLPLLGLADAHAQCTAGPGGVITATAQAGGLSLLGAPMNTVPTGNIPANTPVAGVSNGSIVLNEQTTTYSGGQWLVKITGAHIITTNPIGGAVTNNIELAHVECGTTTPVAPPAVTSISPNQGPETGGTSVAITGSNFFGVSSVKFGSANATSYTVNSLTSITAVAPAGTGNQDVRVANLAGSSAVVAGDVFSYIPKPTITAINPTLGPTAGGTSVVITGTNLTTTSGVKFGAASATGVVVNSATSVTALAPAGSAGSFDVTLTTVGGTSDAVTADLYTYIAPPTVTNVSPSSGPLASGTSVTITGTGFSGTGFTATAVKFGATNAVSFTVNSASQITAVAPAGSVGTFDVTVTTVGGTSPTSSADQYTYVAAPTVTSVSPISGPTSAGTTVVITGTNLTGATGVKFGLNAATGVTVNSSTQITATAPAGTAATVDVTVTTVGGTSATSSSDQYTYVAAPTVTAVSPLRGPLAGGTTVIITGTNLTGASSVKFQGTTATSFTVNSATQITAVAPARVAGAADITVTTVGGTSATSASDQYTYVAAPTVTSVSPSAGPIAGGTSLTINGTGFTGATAVSIGGTAATGVTVSTDTQLVVTTPAHGAGIVDVVVTAPGGTSAISSADQFTYYPLPTVTAVSPTTGPTSAGTVVVITGTNFTGATGVKFGAGAATGVTVNSATQITATAPAGSLSTVDVTVTTPGGTSATSAADQFTYLGPPTVTAVSPARGPLAGGTSVVITGTGFSNATAVKFTGANASSFVVNTATQITAVAPAHAVGATDITVTTAGGTSATSGSDQYTYVNAPTVTAISPTAGPITSGTTVTITGTDFTSATTVTFGGTPATGMITVNSDTQITAVAPAHAAGAVDVIVTAPGGLSAVVAADKYTYTNPPAVTAVSPNSGPVAGSALQTVTLTGTDFTGATSVTFDGYPSIQILSVTATQIQVRGVPPHITGPAHVQVTTPYGASALTTADLYTYQGLPTLTSVSPSSGALAGGTSVVLTGTGFTTATNVSFGANSATFVMNSDTQITATVPAASAGAVNVTVTSLYGVTGGSNPVQYIYVAAPVVSSISPMTGPVAGGTLVTINGTGFSGATGVSFGAVAATGITVSSGTLITAFAPAQAAGTVDVTVTTIGGTSATSAADRFTYVAPPTVTAISPVTGPAVGGTSVIITGTGFSGASAVSFGGTAASSFIVNTGTQITAVTPAHAAGAVDILVTSIGGTSGVVAADQYTFVAAPAITAVSPSAGPLGGAASVTITGTGFTGASAVSFGGTAATSFTVNSATQITATSPANGAGTVDVSVTTVGGTTATVPADRYTYQAAPAVTGLTPSHGPIAGGTLVTITGSGFSGATAVTFGGVPASGVISVSNDTQIIAQAPAHVVGTVDVVVTAPGGTSPAAGTADDFLYVGAPTVSGLAPVNGPIAVGTPVVITGTGFATVTGATSVQFGGSNATSYVVNSDTQLTAVTPAHAAGPAGVTITTADGGPSSATAASTFTYIPVPTVTSIAPGTGPEAGGTIVTISGTALSTATSVRFGATPASFIVNSDTSLSATAPAGTGLVDITVTTAGGTSATGAADRFRYVGTPTVTTISPASGPVAGGTSVTITGTQFYGVTGVSLGGATASFTVDSPTQITAVTPAHAAGAVDLRVTTTDGGISPTGTTFTYVADPVVSGLSPTSGPLPGGTVVVITGSGFSGATAVVFGSTPAASFTVNSGTQITATSPAGSAGTVDVTVTGLYATSATSAADRFGYLAGPVLSSVSPNAGPLGGGTAVTLTGTGFTIGSAVTIGGAAATSVQYVSPTQLTAVVPAAAAGPVDVVVTTPYGQSSLIGGYTYRAAPSVTSITPAAGPEAGGTTVFVTGTGFSAATVVRFGAVNATVFTVSTDTSITATVPAGTGLVDVTVTGPGGTSPAGPADQYRYAPVPVLSAVSPPFGPTAGGTAVTLTGSGFSGATGVTMAGVPVPFTAVNDTTITLTTPGGSGSVPIVVTTPGGSTAPGQFTYANAPTVSGLSPNQGPLTGGTSVTITGTGFTTGSTVALGGTAASSLQFVSSTELTAIAPARASAGSVSVTVTTPYGSASGSYRYVAVPTVTVVQPGAGPLAGGTVVTVTGTGFNDVTSIAFGATPATSFTVNSDTSITAVAPPHAAAAVDLTVSGIGGTSVTTTADRFSYLAAPTVGTLTPVSGPLAGGTLVMITGTGFTPGATVAFGPTPATSVQYVGPTEVRAVAPAGASSGSVLVRVTTAGGFDSGLFTYRDAPTVSQLQPPAGPEAGGTAVVITGSDFSGATAVVFGSVAATFTIDSGTRITATAPPGTGTADVQVIGPGGTSAVTAADRYRYAPVPVVTSLSPTFGPTAGGTALTVSGSGFTGATAVTVSGASVAFVQTGDSTITLTTPPGPAGNADLVVTTPGGSSAPLPFRYADAPTVSALSPNAGPLIGGTSVTISGTDFTVNSTVTFGPTAVASIQYVSPTQLIAVSPARGSADAVDVVVSTPYGSSGSAGALNDFAYTDVPSITTISPSAGPVGGGPTVTIAGSGLTGASSVTFDGVAATSFTVNSDSSITAVTPAGAAGSAVVRVITVGGSDTGTFRYANAPAVSSIAPTEGPEAGGTTVTVAGSGFTGATTVRFGSTSATSITVSSDTQITAVAPAGTGTVDVQVTAPGGSSASSPADQFRYAPVPAITQLAPDQGPLTGGTPVTVTGSGFLGATDVRVDALSVAFTVVNDSTITLSTPSHAVGVAPVVVTTAGGSSPPTSFTYVVAPVVSAVSPTAGPVGGGTTVTISGSGLTAASSVTFDGVAAGSFTVNSDSSITAVTPPGSAGSAVVRVTTVGGSDTGTFRYANTPTVSSITPGAGPEAGGTIVTISGSGFTGATIVRFGANPATGVTVSSDTQITAVAPAGTGPVDVQVTAPGGTSAASPADRFRYAPVPSMTQVSPSSGPVTGGTALTITGTGFTGATTLTIDGVQVPFTALDDTTLTLTTPAAAAGLAAIVVTTPGGSSAPVYFAYVDAPTVTALTPDAGPLGGGTAVTITGTDFTPTSTVTFGGVPATAVQYVSPSQLIAGSPARGPAAVVDVIVSTPYGTSPGAGPGNDFAYTNAPTISTVSPSAGPVGGGTPVTISGSGLTGASSVTFDGVAATSFMVNNDSTITAVAPPGSAGTAVVRVITVGGSDTGSFRYANVPIISAISPVDGPEAGGTLVTIDGSGFTGTSTVLFGSTAATGVTVSSDTRILAFAPAGTGTVDVVVTAPGGTSATSSADHFRYAPVPAIAQLSPSSGPVVGGTPTTITGSDLTGAIDVRIDGAPVTFTLVNGTTITLTTPAHPAGPASVVVTTPGGDSAAESFTYVSAPVATALSPDDGPLAGGTSVTITGTDFTPSSTVTFGATGATSVQYVSGTELTAVSPAHGSAAIVDVVVTTPYGSSPTTGTAGDFSYRNAPVLTSITPRAGPEAGGTVVTLTGSDFTGAASVLFGSTSASFTIGSDTSITATAPPGTGTVNVTVIGPGGTSPAEPFRYAPIPTAGSLSPVNGPLVGGTVVTLTGTGFSGATTVTIGGVSVPFTVVDGSTITFSTPAGSAGSENVVVTTPGGSSGPVSFTYVNVPVVNVISPIAGPLAGGTTVTITGNDLTGATAVTFDGVAASSYTVNNDSTITAVSPPGTAGSAVVQVAAAGGTAGGSFRYAAVPTVTQIQPGAGPLAGGTTVTITGTGFTDAGSVTFDGVVATSFTVNSDSTITAVSPPGSAGTAAVQVTTAGGSGTGTFRYVAIPVISQIQPAAGPLAGGTTVTITGTDLTDAASVTFDGVVASSFTVNSDSSITAVSPPGAAGSAVVRVAAPGGTATGSFRYAAGPAITQIQPGAGPLAGGTTVTISGNDFTGASTVTFDGVAATAFTVDSDSTITAVTPPGAAGAVVVLVVTPGGTTTGSFRYAAVPTITQVLPAAGPLAGGTSVTISGSDFTGAASVTFDGVAATSFTVDNDSTITAVAPPGPAGPAVVRVTTPGGNATGAFRYASVPVITQVQPDAGPLAGGTGVTISGSDLTGATSVTFGGVAATSFTVDNDSTITAVAPPGSAGSAVVRVTAPGGSADGVFRYAAAPTISQIQPGAGPLAGGTTVTISGNDFTGASTVTFDGVAATAFTVTSDSTIIATTPPGSAGPAVVTVAAPGGSATGTFRYAPIPAVTQIQPAAGPEVGGTSVIVTGTGFTGASAVRFGMVGASFTVDSDTRITAVTPAGTGPVDVTVTTPGGISGTSAADRFTYAPVPTIGTVSPDVGPLGGGTVVTLSGSGYTGATGLTIDGVPVPFTVNDDSTFTFTTPAGTAGPKDVVVTTAGGSSAPASFGYVNAPAVSGISPDEGPVAGGTLVTITGTGFTGATSVSFGSMTATSVVVTNATEIIARTPAHSAGPADVEVTGPGGISPAGTIFTYRPVPVIGSLSPSTGPVTGGTVVTVSGTGFTGASGVTIAGTVVPFTVVNDSTVTFTTPADSAGTAAVVLSTAGGSASGGFTYVNAPTVTTLTPSAGPLAGGTAVTITGTGFTLNSTVDFGANAAASVQFQSPTELIATSPSVGAGITVDVVVTTAYGNSGTAGPDNDFAYTDAPVVTGAVPAQGPIAGGNIVSISGSGFTGATSLSFGSTPATSFTVSSDTQITAVAPAHAAGPVDIRVTGSGGPSPVIAGDRYTFLNIPAVSGLTPPAGPVSGGTIVTITGTGFTANSTVTFGGTPSGPVQFVSAGQIVVPSPAAPAGPVDVVVTTPGGSSAPGNSFEYQRTPGVAGLSPSTGPLGGGTAVTITGTDFTPGSTVAFGFVPAGSVQFVSVNRLDVISPAVSSPGPVDVVVTTAGGDSAPEAFTYVARPVITAVQPGSGPIAGGTPVTITGTGFTGATALDFGGGSAIFTVDSDSRITATTPAGTGSVDVTVTTIGGTSAISAADRFTYRTASQISALVPSSGPSAGGTAVTIIGSGFTGASDLAVGGANVAFTVVDDSTITYVAPTQAPGTGTVTVTAPGGAASSGFQYLDIPGISSVSPSSGPLTGGATVTVRGSGFTGATVLRFGSVAVPIWSVSDDSTITAVVPARFLAGPVDVTVTGVGGTSPATTTTTYTYLARPAITSVLPVSGPVPGGTVITLRGTSFTGTTRVLFSGVAAASYVVQDDQTITAVTPAHPAGPVDVEVTTGGGDSDPGAFTFVAAPIVTRLSPEAGPTAGGTTLTISGSDLTAGIVTLDGTVVTPISVSDTEIVVSTPAHPAGPVTVAVTTTGGASDGQFTYVAPQSAPVLSSVSPASGPVVGGDTVTLTGVGFTGATRVRFGGVAATFTVVNDTTITAIVPPGSEGSALVSVTVPNGVTADAVTYVYVAPAVPPTITGVTPVVGPTAGGTRITITGTGFDSTSTVTFDGVPGTGVSVGTPALGLALVPPAIRAADSTTLTVLTPAHAEGPAGITVTNVVGSATATTNFTFIPLLLDASVSLRVQVNATSAVAPQGSLYAGLRAQSCSAPLLGTSSVGANSAFCRYTAPAAIGTDSFTMQVTDVLGQQAAQAVRIMVIDDGASGEGTGDAGGNDNQGGGGTGEGEGGGNTNGGGSGGNGGTGNGGDGGGKGAPDNAGGGTGGQGGNDDGGGNPRPTASNDGKGSGSGGGTDIGGATPTPSPAPTASPAVVPSTAPSSGGNGYLLPLLGLGALLLLLLGLGAWRGWWPWFLLGRRRKKDDEDGAE